MTNASWLPMLVSFACLALAITANAQQTLTKNGADGELIELNEENWQSMLTGEWMIEFFAPWCPACKNLAPTWERFARTAKDVNVNVAKIDVTTSPSLSGRFFVTALPTIYHVKNGEFRQYRGSRDGDALLFFVSNQQWQKLEPLSAWKKPDTIHMSVLSYFFKLSHTLKHSQILFKDFNARLQDEYGLPPWGSYALFAIATIFVGAALGLLLVCIVDLVYPPKKSSRQSFSDAHDLLHSDGVEDLAAEEIEDDAPNEDADEDDDAEEEEADEDDEEAEGDNDGDETSEGEKLSRSESEAEEDQKENIGDVATKTATNKNEKKLNTTATEADQNQSQTAVDAEDETATPKTEVRKRKPRKAD